MMRYGFKGFVGGGAATMEEGPIQAYQDAAARTGRQLAPGEGLCLGIGFYLAESRERAIREITPLYEEHAKMFGPLHFLPMSDAQKAAVSKRGGWTYARCADSRALHGPGIVVRRHIGGTWRIFETARRALPWSGTRGPQHADGDTEIENGGDVSPSRGGGHSQISIGVLLPRRGSVTSSVRARE